MSRLSTSQVKRSQKFAQENGRPVPAPGNEGKPKAARARHPGGRPTDYSEEILHECHVLARHGATDAEIAMHLGVSIPTYYAWRNKHPEFVKAVDAGKALWDDRVEASLARRAIGYEIESEKVFANGHRAKVIEHIPADVGAATNWLANRRPDRWRPTSRLEVEHSGAIEHKSEDARALAMATLALLTQAAGTAPEPLTIEGNTDDQASTTPPPEGADDPREPDTGHGGGQSFDDFLEP